MGEHMKLLRGCLVFGGLGLGLACGGAPQTPEEARQAEEERAKQEQEAAEADAAALVRGTQWAAYLAKIPAAIDPWAPVPNSVCTKEELDAIVKDGVLDKRLYYSGIEGLPGGLPYGDGQNWSWLDHPDLVKAAEANGAPEKHQELLTRFGRDPQHRLVLVYVATDRSLPGPMDKQGYDMGIWIGSVQLFDLEANRVLCSQNISVESSEDLKFDDDGLFKDDPVKVPLKDFQKHMEKATNAALKKMAPRFEVNLVGW